MKAPDSADLLSDRDLARITDIIRNIHGFDFSNYAQASLKRRVNRILQLQKMAVSDLCDTLTNDMAYFDWFLTEITVNVTEMFRDPDFYLSLKENIIPYLKSYPDLKVWSAGCSTGEELYSFAILFNDEKLYERSFFYGTDINPNVLNQARSGIYDLQKMKQYSENYKESGSITSLANYYTAQYNAAVLNHSIKQNTLLSVHNLISDGVFNEFHIISCRNVLIYFNTELQKKVINLFYHSLANFGFLCLGSKESLKHSDLAENFKIIDRQNNIYQKITKQ